MMRLILAVALALLAGPAGAHCPPCVAGGGPKATDCYLQWADVPGPTLALSCADGDTSCDADATVDGACTFALDACVGEEAVDGCTPAELSGAPTVTPANEVAQALQTALSTLPASECAETQLRVPLKASLKGIKKAVVKLKVTATAGGKKDVDKLKLTCLPSTNGPSFATAVQPIFTAKCAIAGCHIGTPIVGLSAPNMETGQSYGEIVGQRAPSNAKKVLVQPGSVKKSYVAAKILGQKISGLQMPQGCPGGPLPAGGCLTDVETFTILQWIQSGAPNN